MANYDFKNLSDIEFESLTQDLLQEDLKVKLERFTSGRDKGIDLRYAVGSNNLIVQCKRYSDFSSLFSNLKKEVEKVKLLKTTRYIIATSVGLTPQQKGHIKDLFNPFILEASDILGKEDLNNLLNINGHIERNHFKLWLTSTNILNKILHSKVCNQSQFEVEKIKDNINIYVQNQSFREALNILQKENFAIISGIPGIGKTTLARILVYYFLANDFEEFIFLSDNINDAYEFYLEDKKQVFLFDDFLGSNLLEDKLLRNEEKRIIDFIEKIRKSKNKILILTTREYVLNQAKDKFEAFENFEWAKAKCIVDLSKYTKPIRARILYNHLFFSNLPPAYINDLLTEKRYLKIIDHPNYSPRIIEGLTLRHQWEHIEPDGFYKKFNEFLSYPESIWNHAFNNQISNLSKWILLILATTGSEIFLEDIRAAIQNFVKIHAKKYKLIYTDSDFKHSLKELENTFILIIKDSQGGFIISFQNPSVYDFLIKFLEGREDSIKDLVQSFIFMNQFFTIFSTGSKEPKKIQLNKEFLEIYLSKILNDFDYLGRTNLTLCFSKDKPNTTFWRKREQGDLYKIDEILKHFNYAKISKIKKFIKNRIHKFKFENISSDDQQHLLNILRKVGQTVIFDTASAFENLFKNMDTVDDVSNFLEFKSMYPQEYLSSLDDHTVSIKMVNVIDTEIETTDPKYYEDLLSRLQNVQNDFSVNEHMIRLEEMIDENKRADEERWEHIDPDDFPSFDPSSSDDDQKIIDMFESLIK